MRLPLIFDRWRYKIRDLRETVGAYTPYQKCKFIHSCGIKAFELIGINVLSDCVLYWLSPIAGLAILSMYISQAYTMWFYWHDNKISAIQPLAVTAMLVQVNICDHIFCLSEVLLKKRIFRYI